MKSLRKAAAALMFVTVLAFGTAFANTGILIHDLADSSSSTSKNSTPCGSSATTDKSGILIHDIVGILIHNLTGILIHDAAPAPTDCGILIHD